jgi:hypothetical protein
MVFEFAGRNPYVGGARARTHWTMARLFFLKLSQRLHDVNWALEFAVNCGD